MHSEEKELLYISNFSLHKLNGNYTHTHTHTHTHTQSRTEVHDIKQEETERKIIENYQIKITHKNKRTKKQRRPPATRKQKIKLL